MYCQKDGRKMVYDKDKKQGVPYARYLMEQHLGRKLNKDDEVHHKDHNKTNDVINKNSISYELYSSEAGKIIKDLGFPTCIEELIIKMDLMGI